MSMPPISSAYNSQTVAFWCDEICNHIKNLDIFKTSKIVCSINFNFKNRKSINLKYEGIHFSSHWRMLAPKTTFMYRHDGYYINDRREQFNLFFINIDPGFFLVNDKLNFKQNFFFFFFHEFAHCIDLSSLNNDALSLSPPNQSSIELFSEPQNVYKAPLSTPPFALNEQLSKELFADIFALKLINNFYPNLNVSPSSIAQFRQKEFDLMGNLASNHYTAQYLTSQKVINFISSQLDIKCSLSKEIDDFKSLQLLNS